MSMKFESQFECTIKGITVRFPFEPYDLQKQYMTKVIECLENGQNGVLESPTGTGKTLSLLCSTLAWLETKKARIKDEIATGFGQLQLHGPALLSKFNETSDNTNRPLFQCPQIIYSSRTHSQLSQAMNELKRTSYNYMRASVLGSREQMCVHPEIKVLENNATKVQMCKAKVQAKGCCYHNRVEFEKDNRVFKDNSIIDIEDLVKFGDNQKFCPYYMSRELIHTADIIFMPYNYILDPRVRKGLGIELTNSIIILDEAHNVEKMCEDSASIQIKNTHIALCIDVVTAVIRAISDNNKVVLREFQPDFSTEDLMMLKGMFLSFKKAMEDEPISPKEEGSTFDGTFIFKLFESAEITDKNAGAVAMLLERIGAFVATERHLQQRGHGLQRFEDLLGIAFAKIDADFKAKLQKCYKVHMQEAQDYNLMGSSTKFRMLSYWCFSAGFGMKMFMEQGIKCMILTSGTLAPLNALIIELGLKFDVRLENPHIIQNDQVCLRILSRGPDSIELNSSFNKRRDPAYISSLAKTIANFARVLPGGLLIFFPSYPIMEMCEQKWKAEGSWATINKTKPIFVEPRNKTIFAERIKKYYATVNDTGAIFMGVCRGKLSEGLDFMDANGRAVIIIGLPYAPWCEPRIVLKRKYLDNCRSQNREYLNGKDWYDLEAVKAVNQAIGRVIRHRNDYGAIILLDTRFNSTGIINQMSSWLRSHVKHGTYQQSVQNLNAFFRNAQKKYPVSERKPGPDLSLVFSQYECSGKAEASSQEASTGEVNIHKREGDRNESDSKRMKPTHKDNLSGLVDAGEVCQLMVQPIVQPESLSQAQLREYALKVRKHLPPNDCTTLIAMMTSYNRDGDIQIVFETLLNLFQNNQNFCQIVPEFRNFVKIDDLLEYDAFVDKHLK